MHKVGRPLQPPTDPVLFETYNLRRMSKIGFHVACQVGHFELYWHVSWLRHSKILNCTTAPHVVPLGTTSSFCSCNLKADYIFINIAWRLRVYGNFIPSKPFLAER